MTLAADIKILVMIPTYNEIDNVGLITTMVVESKSIHQRLA